MKTAAIITRDTVVISMSQRMLEGVCHLVPFASMQSCVEYIYTIIPDLLIVDIVPDDATTIGILNTVKSDPIFTHLPVLAVIGDTASVPDWSAVQVEDYIWKSQMERDMRDRTSLCLVRSDRVVELNPLTRLPGNISINRTIQGLIDAGSVFAMGYADLDNFKPYNDHYGFSRGDEVIKMTGRLILNIVKSTQPEQSFVGHIGGDDFIYIMDADIADESAAHIVAAFDRIIPTFYDVTDREAGSIMSTDRLGNKRSFPLMSLSIGVCSNRNRELSHYGQITEAVSEMKRYAKRSKGSCYRSDRRAEPQGKGTAQHHAQDNHDGRTPGLHDARV
jgi:diguanylate cyclase (GGDEF)-like protein